MPDNKPTKPDDDWLLNDPLGLNMMDDESDNIMADSGLHEETITEQAMMTEQTDMTPSPTAHSNTHDSATNVTDRPTNANISTDSINTDTISTVNTSTNNISTDIMTADAISSDTMTIMDDDAPADLPKFDGDTSRANPHFQPLLPKPIHRHEPNRQLIMDTETTGLDALKGDRIIEVGIVEMIGRKFTGEKLHVYINPQRGMDDVVIRIHGISEAFLADKPTFDQIAEPLYEFMDGAELIAHNAPFDISFLSMEFAKLGITDFAERVQVTDTLVMAKQQYPGQRNTLDALVRRLDVGKQDRTFHGALLDSEILAEVYLAMTGGQVALAIEAESESEDGHTTHANLANLASLLRESVAGHTANQSWFANLSEEYPEIKTKMSQW